MKENNENIRGLKVVATKKTVQEPSFDQKIAAVIGIANREEEQESLAVRYFEYDAEVRIENNIEKRLNLIRKDEETIRKLYPEAIKKLKPEVRDSLRVEDFNLIVYGPKQTVTLKGSKKYGEGKSTYEFDPDNIILYSDLKEHRMVDIDLTEVHPAYYEKAKRKTKKTSKKEVPTKEELEKNSQKTTEYLWRPILLSDFCEEVSDEDKVKYFRAIRDYLFIDYATRYKKELKAKKQNSQAKTLSDKKPLVLGGNIPNTAVRFLYEATCGKHRKVIALSKLCAQIKYKRRYITPTVILAHKSLHNGLRAMLCSVGRAFDADLSAAVGQRGALGVFCLNLNSVCRAFISTNSPVPTSYRKYERLRKLMYGYKLNVPYPDFQGELFVNNRIPFIYITDNHEYFNIMKYHYGAKSIELPGCSSHNIENGVFHDWYKEDFADYGQYCLGKSSAQPFPKMNITEDRIIKRFIKDICILDENADIPKAELTEAYENYFRKFYGETTLKPKLFKNKIAVIANLSDCRPHHSSKSNPICFKGIKIDEEKYAKLLEMPNEENFKTDIETFGDALFDLIYKDTMPPEEYEHAKRRFVSNKGVKIKLSEKH